MAAFSRGKPRLFSGTCIGQIGVPSTSVIADPNAHLVCLADWLGNRTLRNFLLRYSEPLWADVARSLCLLGVLCLRHLAPSLDSAWGSDDLATLVDYIQREERWPEELTPVPSRSGEAWEPPWKQQHWRPQAGAFQKPSPEWRVAGLADAGGAGHRALSAARMRQPPGPHGRRSAGNPGGVCKRADTRARSVDAQQPRTSMQRSFPKKPSTDKVSFSEARREQEEFAAFSAGFSPVDFAPPASAASHGPLQYCKEWGEDPVAPPGVARVSRASPNSCDDTSGAVVYARPEDNPVESSANLRRGPAQMAEDFLRSSLGAAFRSTQRANAGTSRAPDTAEWHDAEERRRTDADRLFPSPEASSPSLHAVPLDGCSELRDPRLARGGWAAEVPMHSAGPRFEEPPVEVDEVWTDTASEPGELSSRPPRHTVADSPFRATCSPESVSSTPSSVLGLGSAWSCSGGPLSRPHA
mmetsp:Transcript_27456/g.50042  ORF Transcript_27456/g.50042 Transcript_27456/m.50042 type:complete len:468 (+) Transcript_27456:85-1488(+)